MPDPRQQGLTETFLGPLLREGRAVLGQRPASAASAGAEIVRLLEQAYAAYRLSVAGPLLAFDAEAALAAAALVHHACWFLVDRTQPATEVEQLLPVPGPPRSPAEQLSTDLVLRYLVQVHRRAWSRDPADPLTARLSTILRHRPLTGVLSAVAEGPLAPTDFGGHPGLLLLYAERWCRHEKPAWMPEGLGLEYLEWVWSELGKDPAVLHRAGLAASQPLREAESSA